MNKKAVGLLVLATAVLVAAVFVFLPTGSLEVSAKTADPIQIDLVVEVGPKQNSRSTLKNVQGALESGGFNVDSFFDVYYVSNIGSSGQDGVRRIGSSGIDGFSVDSFFDVFFEINNTSRTIPIEMVALSLRSVSPAGGNPEDSLELVERAVEGDGGVVYYGHVTVLK